MISQLKTILAKVARRARYELFDAPRGFGRPIARDAWERMYQEGSWDRLNELSELAHYSIIVGYVRAFPSLPIVWDIGCGQGRLLQLLRPHFHNYTGVDVSAEAIQRAHTLGLSDTRFAVSSFEDWLPEKRADVIIFNESLHYAAQPATIIDRYSAHLSIDGRIIISLLEYGNHRAVWRALKERLNTLASTRVENSQGQAWNVRMFRPKDR